MTLRADENVTESIMIIRAFVAVMGLLVAMPLTLAQTRPSQGDPPAAAPPSADSPVKTVPTLPSQLESDDPRYSFHRVPDGYLRLDASTGRVAMCSRRQVGWACQVLPDDRTVLEAEIARLQLENGRLKKVLLSRGIPLPSGTSAPSATRDGSESRQPGASMFDQFLAAVAATWRRLAEMVARIHRDITGDG